MCWRALSFLALLGIAAMAASADTYPRQPGIDVLRYSFELELSDESDEIVGRTTIELRLLEEGVEAVTFDLVGRASSQAATGMTVTAVRWAGSDDGALFTHEDDRLTVKVPAAIARRDIARLEVAYRGKPAMGLVIGENKHGERCFFSDNWPIKARHWLVTVDHPYEKAASEMIVTAPDHYQVVSNGLLIEETDLGDGRRLTHWRQSIPIATWLNTLGVAHFAVQHLEPVAGIPIQTWVYAQDRDAGFYDFAVPTPHTLEFFSDHIGPYPYEKLANVQSNSIGGGMESASAIFYGDDSVTGERTERWRNVVIHEIAHQWWGNSVTEADWDDVWLSEGFATYFTMLFIEHAYGRDEMVKLLERGRDYVFDFAEENPDYTIVHDNLDDMGRVLTGNIYQKGGWTLHMLRELVGDEAFWDGIRDYFARFRDANATTADFRRTMEEASGRDLTWFFDQWLHRGGALEIDGTWTWDASLDVLALTLDQVQPNGLPYHMSIELSIVDAEGTERLEILELGTLHHEFEIELGAEPTAVKLDPDLKVLVRWQLRRQ